jgi:hypothetical protein
MQAEHTLHSKKEARDRPAKDECQRNGRLKTRDAARSAMFGKPKAEIEDDADEKSGLRRTQDEPEHIEAQRRLHECGRRR